VSGTEIETEKERGNGNGKERPVHPWPFHRAPFSRTSVNAIVWKARCIIVTVTATAIVEEPAHIIHSLPLRPRFRQYENRVRACLGLECLHHRVGGHLWNWIMTASEISIMRGCVNARGTERGTERGSGTGKEKEKGILERRNPINAMGWVTSTQLCQRLYHASPTTTHRTWATRMLR
jgi:hypothetical protein